MRKTIMAGLLASTVIGCRESGEPAAKIPADLVGEWHADAACAPPCSFTLTWKENPQAVLDAISLGMALRMEIGASGRFRFGDVTALPPAGTVRVAGSELVVTDAAGVVDTIAYRLEGSALRLEFRREFTVVDFNADGRKDPSSARAVFQRR
ncbi:MAG: hypothetical protein FIB01_01480 [Gemmatimonadetes bacterium]|nr:hypothetical protein [Gemmatimonadota bacterium]